MPVLVRDAETKKPIAMAEVGVSYPVSQSPFAPPDSSSMTGSDGIARFWVAPFGDGIGVDATAAGYLPERKEIAVTTIEKIPPVHLFQSSDQRPASVIVELYAEPQFDIEFIVPAGYRGIVKADVDLQDRVSFPRGQRRFSYVVSPTGEVEVRGPSLLRRLLPQSYHARYADGTPLSGDMKAKKVGFRWLRQDGKQQYYVVGTQNEYDQFARDGIGEANHTSGSSETGKGSHRNGRHRASASTSPE
jgi:hypothetical protein